jgi:hypothetical protein
MANSQAEMAAAVALRAIRQGRTADAAAALQSCLSGAPMATQAGASVIPGGRQWRSGTIGYHVFTVPGIGAVPNDGNLHKVSIQWPTTGANMRVLAMMGTVLSASVADMCNISVGIECNNQEQLVASGRSVKQAPYSSLFPVSAPHFSFATTRKAFGVPIFSNQNWTASFYNEGGTAANISPTLEFLIEHDDPNSPASFDVAAYGSGLGVYVFRPDDPTAIPNTGAGNPAQPSSIYFATSKPNQRVVAWTGSVQSGGAHIQDFSNASAGVSPNGAENLVTNGQGVGLTGAFASFGSLFGNNAGRAERWLPFGSRATHGMPVAADEQWQIVFASLGSANGSIIPSCLFRCETD